MITIVVRMWYVVRAESMKIKALDMGIYRPVFSNLTVMEQITPGADLFQPATYRDLASPQLSSSSPSPFSSSSSKCSSRQTLVFEVDCDLDMPDGVILVKARVGGKM